ncbi:MAG TPA: DsbA family protein [Stellaceae bacterium]|nr:DsbA family protein [Stellaceae bacterium]
MIGAAAALPTGVLIVMLFCTRRATPSADPTLPPRRPRLWALGLCMSALLALLPPRPAAAAEFTPDQRQAIEGIVRDYLAKNPEILLDAMQAAEDKARGAARNKASAALAARQEEVFNDPDAPVGGNPRGDASLVEFFDYRCPYCKQVEPSLEALLAKDKELRFVYKEFPVLGPASVTAARAALAARQQGKYDAFHKAMMNTKGEFDEAVVFKVASSIGLDVDRLKHDMAAPEIDRILKANAKLAAALDIRGTPGFVVGNEIVPGAISLEALKKLIDAARQK